MWRSISLRNRLNLIFASLFALWLVADAIHDYNYQAVKESIERAVNGKPTPAEVVSQRDSAKHPFSPS
jgi:5,6,7,8-tetrahydromethanopterin hydro-lyase